MSGLPSLPPPVYKSPKLVSLLDSKALGTREAEHKKWQMESQILAHPLPIGVRPADISLLGLDLDEEDEESLEDSVEEAEESLMDDSDSVQASESVPPEDVDEWNIPAEDTVHSEDTMNESSPQQQN